MFDLNQIILDLTKFHKKLYQYLYDSKDVYYKNMFYDKFIYVFYLVYKY